MYCVHGIYNTNKKTNLELLDTHICKTCEPILWLIATGIRLPLHIRKNSIGNRNTDMYEHNSVYITML